MNNTDKGKEGKSQINRTICFFFIFLFLRGGGGVSERQCGYEYKQNVKCFRAIKEMADTTAHEKC